MQWEWIFSWTTTRRQVSRDLWLWRPRPLIAHWMAYQQKPSSELGMSLPSNLGQNDHEMPPQVRQNLQPQGALSTASWHWGHCQWRNKGVCRLPLWRLNPVLLRLLIFDTPWGSSGWRQHSVLQRIWWDRYLDSWIFSETDFMIPTGKPDRLQSMG